MQRRGNTKLVKKIGELEAKQAQTEVMEYIRNSSNSVMQKHQFPRTNQDSATNIGGYKQKIWPYNTLRTKEENS